MSKEITILFILQYIILGLPLSILLFSYRKINIRNSYKIIIGTFLLIGNIISTILIITYSNILKYDKNNNIIEELFPNGSYVNLVFSIPVLIGLGVLIFYFIRISLGKIDIKIFGNKFTSGDKLTGEINLKFKKNIINSNLYVYLRGYQYINLSPNLGPGSSLKKIYEDKIILEKDIFFKSNYIKNYNFSFNIPYNIGKDNIKLWRIEARLEKKGIDLFNQKVVNITRTEK